MVVGFSAKKISIRGPCMVGIDEAGRGPVLGPLVYGACYCSESHAQALRTKHHVADSKTITADKRTEIIHSMDKDKQMGWFTDVVTPEFISNSMLSRKKVNLNTISHSSVIRLITLLLKNNVEVKHVYVDAIGTPSKLQSYLSKTFPDIGVTVSNKADSLFPIVSAASIVAKVNRDILLSSWNSPDNSECLKIPYGSGYPGDPITVNWLRSTNNRIFGFQRLVRFSWSTCENLLEPNVVWPTKSTKRRPNKNEPKTILKTIHGKPSNCHHKK